MNALNRLSIRTRLYFGTVFSLVLLVVIGAMGYLALERTRNTLEVLFTQRVQTLTDMGELRTTLGDLRRAEKTSSSTSTTRLKCRMGGTCGRSRCKT